MGSGRLLGKKLLTLSTYILVKKDQELGTGMREWAISWGRCHAGIAVEALTLLQKTLKRAKIYQVNLIQHLAPS